MKRDKEAIKWENILSPQEMKERFGSVKYKVTKGGEEIYINSDYFVARLLDTMHEKLSYRVISRNIPYIYRRIVEEAKSSKDPSLWDAILERRTKKSSSNV